MADTPNLESEDLTAEELDAQIGPEAEHRAFLAAEADRVARAQTGMSAAEVAKLQAQADAEAAARKPTKFDSIIHAPDVYGNPALLGGPAQPMRTHAEEPSAVAPAPQREPTAEPVDAEQQVTAQIVKNAITPTITEIQASAEGTLAPIRQEVADRTALEIADKELSKFISIEQQRQADLQNQIQQVQQRTENEVRAKSLPEIMVNGNFGQRILAILAVGMGAAAQGLSGSDKNPVMEYIDTLVNQQAAKDKLNFEQKLALQNELLKSSQNIVLAARSRFDNADAVARLDLEYAKLGQAQANISAKFGKAVADNVAGRELVAEQMQSGVAIQGNDYERAQIQNHNNKMVQMVQQLPPKDAQLLLEKKIVLPNGKITFSSSDSAQIGKFNAARASVEAAKSAIKELKQFAQNFNKIDPRDRRAIATRLSLLAGTLREEVLGPGAMTQEEYQRLYNALGDPTKWGSVAPIEIAALNSVEAAIDAGIAEKAKFMAGVDWPVSKRAQAIQKLTASGVNAREAREIVDKLERRKLNGR